MRHPCEVAARHLLPAFRSLIAKGLIEDYGFTQAAAAKKLGTTQAAISYYLSSKRGERYIQPLETTPLVASKIRAIVTGLEANALSSAEVAEKLCDLCTAVRTLNLVNTAR
jgi:predicted transcriptional regulator